MPQFNYEARDMQGILVKGVIEATSTEAAKLALANNRLFPVVVREKSTGLALNQITFERKPKVKDLANMTRQFQVMFSVGMPMDLIFATLIKQTHHKGLQAALQSIRKNIAAGVSLSRSFKQFPKYFDSLFVSMIEAGEVGGMLGKSLAALASILDKEHWLKGKIKSAMLYPKLVAGALVVVSAVVLAFVIPPFEGIYKQLGGELPLPTQILVFISNALRHYWYLCLGGGIGAVFAFRKWAATKSGKLKLDRFILKVPIFGRLNLLTENARFGHLMSSLYKSGLPFVYGLSVTAKTVNNSCFAAELLELRDKVDQGSSLAKGLEHSKYFTPLIKEMCSVGEKTGKIDETLESAALFYDEEIDALIKNLTTLIEPLLLVVMFSGVALLALAVYLPIWNLSSTMLKH